MGIFTIPSTSFKLASAGEIKTADCMSLLKPIGTLQFKPRSHLHCTLHSKQPRSETLPHQGLSSAIQAGTWACEYLGLCAPGPVSTWACEHLGLWAPGPVSTWAFTGPQAALPLYFTRKFSGTAALLELGCSSLQGSHQQRRVPKLFLLQALAKPNRTAAGMSHFWCQMWRYYRIFTFPNCNLNIQYWEIEKYIVMPLSCQGQRER